MQNSDTNILGTDITPPPVHDSIDDESNVEKKADLGNEWINWKETDFWIVRS